MHSLWELKLDNAFDLLSGIFERLEKIKVPITVADKTSADCGLVFANDAFSNLTGYERGDVLGKNCRFLQGPTTNPCAIKSIRVAVEENERLSACVLNFREDGSPFHNLLMLAPISIRGEVRFILGCQYKFDAVVENAAIAEQIDKFNGILSYFPSDSSDTKAYWRHHQNSTDSVRMIIDSYLRMHEIILRPAHYP